jgi:hypothetical protein
MSVYLEDEIIAAGRSPLDLLKVWTGYRLCYLTVGQLRHEFGQVIDRDPTDDFPGHALVRSETGRRTQRQRSRMAMAAQWYEEQS